ncbi:hypothetical protein Anapl_11468 [Anas platyrhynchos]|uniref:Uncharacterized protein n=1 Tax=Anas platyrhynchos TaxID=8839 RepID=R0LJZ5_ANAPL|nr:hypothetical protein Anapl_11468 [Anas platyrhynchos]
MGSLLDVMRACHVNITSGTLFALLTCSALVEGTVLTSVLRVLVKKAPGTFLRVLVKKEQVRLEPSEQAVVPTLPPCAYSRVSYREVFLVLTFLTAYYYTKIEIQPVLVNFYICLSDRRGRMSPDYVSSCCTPGSAREDQTLQFGSSYIKKLYTGRYSFSKSAGRDLKPQNCLVLL